MAEVFPPGYLAVLSVDSTDVSAYCESFNLTQTRNAIRKPTFGEESPQHIGGLKDGTISGSGHVSVAGLPALQTAFDNAQPVTFDYAPSGAGSEESGSYAGSAVLSSFDVGSEADGQVSFTFDGATSGAIVYTAPTP